MNLYSSSPARSLSGPSGGALTEEAETSGGRVSWVHDPADLVPSALQAPSPGSRNGLMSAGSARPDVLTFTASRSGTCRSGRTDDRFAETQLLGRFHAHFVKLLDVAPDIARGLRASPGARRSPAARAAGAHRPQPYGLPPAAGRALRVHISSSDFPLYLPHPGSEEDPWYATAFVQNRQLSSPEARCRHT